MAIHQTKKQSDLEKRLQLLRRQVYGKPYISPQHPISHIPHPTSASAPIRTDLTYLRQDLLKIATFASLAVGAQLILFFLLQNHILNLNFF